MNKVSILLVPFITYCIAYLVLAQYHHTLLLMYRTVHESGAFTLIETIGYAPHALAHIPVHIVVALLFCGWYVRFGGPITLKGIDARLAAIICVSLIGVLFLVSFSHFGADSTYAYISQNKQSEARYVPGGSWLLHIPSMVTLIGVLPIYLSLFFWIWNIPQASMRKSRMFFSSAAIFASIYSYIFIAPLMSSLYASISDPRYVAHSIREIATFPFTYFPIPLYLLVRRSNGVVRTLHIRAIFLTALVTCIVLAYQLTIALRANVHTLSQQPSFTNGDSLPTSYLLASHYFEHVTDTIYFTCFVIIFLYLYAKLGKLHDTNLDTTV